MEVLQAIDWNNPEKFSKVCAAKGANLEAVDDYGNTPLLKACYLGYYQMVKILLSYEANIQAINYMGQNALTLAVHSGSEKIVSLLLSHRSYEDFTLSSMIPPLCVAILRGHDHLITYFWKMQPTGEEIKTVHGLTAKEMLKIYAHRR